MSDGPSLAEILTKTNCAAAARTSDEQRLVDIAAILAAGILRLQDRQLLTVAEQKKLTIRLLDALSFRAKPCLV